MSILEKILSALVPKPKMGMAYRFDEDYGGKFSDGTPRSPLKYIPTKIENGTVFYDVICPDEGFIHGNSSSLFTFWTCYVRHQ
jgi:hypothetical protein